MSEPRGASHFVVATAGHVDHGKSSLVKALTGTDPDRLPEEKARGITIDLGFARLLLNSPDTRPAPLDLGIVDVPGHEDFVKNMVAGVGSVDLALFVVAADDGWMPQSEEHLQILSYLGVQRAVVALTKVDLVHDEAASIDDLRRQLAESPFANAPIVPVSIVTSRGLDELRSTLARVLTDAPAPPDIGKPRLWVDRVFTLRGVGTVVTGTLAGGTLWRGQAVVLEPSGVVTRIRGLQSHNRELDEAGPGMRVALNLPDVDAASQPAHSADGARRGQVVTLPGLGGAGLTWDVLLERSPRLKQAGEGTARPLKNGSLVRLHIGSTHVPTRLALLEGEQLEPATHGLAQLRHESAVYAFAGDRFILRDWAEQHTLAGGILLDPAAPRAHLRAEARRAFLRARAASPTDASAFVASLLARDGAARQPDLLAQSRFSADETAAAVRALVAAQAAVAAGEWLVESAGWKRGLARAGELIEEAHRRHPERQGLPLTDLRAALEGTLREPSLFDPLLQELGRTGFVIGGAAIRRAAHRPALPPHLQAAGARLRAALTAKPLEPPSRKELAPDAASQQVLRFLIQSGEAVEISDEIILSAEACQQMREAIVQHLRARGPATASELRQRLGTTRRVLVPLLERLDKDGVTRRDGDLRWPGRNA